MGRLGWIIGAGAVMTALTGASGLMMLYGLRWLQRWTFALVAFAAGALLGGAFFHMVPAALHEQREPVLAMATVAAGFVSFLLIEQYLHWHHSHGEQEREHDCRAPVGYLVLVGDGLHALLDGLAVGAAFLADIRLGITTLLVAAAHELPQEIGDFGVLVHSGWSPRRALLMNVLSSLPFLLGGALAFSLAKALDTRYLVAFAAGNFIYIGASDLVPEVKHHHGRRLLHAAAVTLGLVLLLAMALLAHDP